jgi:hypothetical protein
MTAEDRARRQNKMPPYELPQEGTRPSSEALEAAVSGDAPPPEPGLAGESDASQPSRAEVLALNPELAAEDGVSSTGTPTMPVHPTPGEPPVVGHTTAGSKAPARDAPEE